MRPILLLLPFLQEKEVNVCHGHMSALLPFVEEDAATELKWSRTCLCALDSHAFLSGQFTEFHNSRCAFLDWGFSEYSGPPLSMPSRSVVSGACSQLQSKILNRKIQK